mgnify:FL=1
MMHLLVFVPPMIIALAVILRAGTSALLNRDVQPDATVPTSLRDDANRPAKR